MDRIGEKVSSVDDASETCMITEFEDELRLRKVQLKDYERAVKKFAFHSQSITLRQMQEGFKDVLVMEGQLQPGTLDYKVMTHDFMLEKNSPSRMRTRGRSSNVTDGDENVHDNDD